ncbi:MFS transporter [Kiritimatiella glycovorans]|uniref:Putative transporter n=1 Tax=Kiritimatiella glycovorans TaxID=1307763 RepID=A0A0G3EER8_9BACT|nr:MFS transporter [Kiritimatiella glycovorans]AKJ63877.1 putative transporter [Kiritimatiella glycovorans]
MDSMLFATIVAITSVFGLGMTMALLGSVKLRLTRNLGIDDARMGRLFSVYNFSNLIFVLLAGMLCDKMGFKAVAIMGYVLGALAIFLFGKANKYGAAILGCVLLGIGGMFMNSVGNTMLTYESILFEDASTSNNFGNVFFGIGAFCVPLITAWLFRKTTYAATLTALACIILVPVVFAIFGTFPEPPTGFSMAKAAELIMQPHIILGALALMCYIALEVSMGGWITTYMSHLGATEERASRALSGFWVAVMAGRLLASLVVARIFIGMGTSLDLAGPWFILGLGLVAAITLFSMVKIHALGAASLAVIITGLVFAPVFPTVIGVTLSRTAAELRGSAFGLIFAVGLVGAIFLPAWMGAISSGEGRTIKDSMKVAGGTAVVLAVLALIMGLALRAPVGG